MPKRRAGPHRGMGESADRINFDDIDFMQGSGLLEGSITLDDETKLLINRGSGNTTIPSSTQRFRRSEGQGSSSDSFSSSILLLCTHGPQLPAVLTRQPFGLREVDLHEVRSGYEADVDWLPYLKKFPYLTPEWIQASLNPQWRAPWKVCVCARARAHHSTPTHIPYLSDLSHWPQTRSPPACRP